eukprot:7204742-Ditylum_brightwellii.AAC.2
MASNVPTVKEIERLFPHIIIPNIQGEPTYDKLYEVQKLLMGNAASIETLYGGRNHGHLGLIINSIGTYRKLVNASLFPQDLQLHPHYQDSLCPR